MATQTLQNSGSSTAVLELEPVHLTSSRPQPHEEASSSPPQQKEAPVPRTPGGGGGSPELGGGGGGGGGGDPPATEAKQNWNSPRSNIPRVAACLWSFIVMGANDAAYGPLIPYIQEWYGISYIVVSLLFLSPFGGYAASALLNNWIHLRVGQRGIAFLGPLCHLCAYAILAAAPPYPALVVAFLVAGFGNGLGDAAWNAWVGDMASANEVLGVLHGLYGLGAVFAPLLATSMIAKAGLPWNSYYYIMIGIAFVELVVLVAAFWKQDGAAYREAMAASTPGGGVGGEGERTTHGRTMREVLFRSPRAARVTWLCSLFLLGYVGVEVALGGWIVEFMIRARDGEPFASGMAATGFWLGITVGRLVLGFVTPRIGEKLAIMIYLPITIGCELLFWLVPQFVVSAVAVGLQGFFLGPLFPAAVVAMSKMLPRHMHVGAIGFAAAFGGSGAAVLPFAVGALAQARGVAVLQPAVLALLVAITLLWAGLPRIGGGAGKRE